MLGLGTGLPQAAATGQGTPRVLAMLVDTSDGSALVDPETGSVWVQWVPAVWVLATLVDPSDGLALTDPEAENVWVQWTKVAKND